MEDVDKTKEQLIDELGQLRQRIAELEATETARSVAEAMLREGENSYQDILDNMLEGCQIIGFDWRYLYLNEVAASHGQRPKERLLGQTMMEAYPGIEKTEMFAQLRRCMEKRTSHRMENDFVFPDGHKGCFELSMEPVPEGVLILSKDITEQKKIEESLKQSEAKYRELAESITDVFFAMDENLRYTYWNKASEELIGISAEDALGKHIHDIFPDDENTRIATITYWKALTTKKPQYITNNFFIGGRGMVFEISVYPTSNGLCVYGRDITERKKMEEALAESELWYRHIFDNPSFGIGFASIDGKVINLNKTMETITGYSAEDFGTVNLADTYVNRADREMLLREVRRHGGVVDYPVQLRRKDGIIYDALLSVRLVTIGDRELVQTICNEVTERKRAEEALRESELRFRAFFEYAPAYAYMVSYEGKIMDINQFALKTLGYTEGELIGKSIINTVYAPESRRKARRLFKKWQETGRLENEELKIITKEGIERIILLSAGVVIDAEGNFLYSISMQRDITERKQAEEEYRTIIHTAMDGFVLLDMQGHFLDVNEAYCHIIGYSRDEILDMALSDVEIEEGSGEVIEHMQKVREAGYGRFETRHRCKDGDIVGIEVSVKYVPTAGGRLVAFYRDITERKKAEEALQESEERYRSLVELSPDAIFVAIEGKHVFVNSAGMELYGASSPDQIIGKPIMDFIHPDYRAPVAERIRMAMQTKKALPAVEEKFIRLDGREIDIEARAIPFIYQGKSAIQAVARDISERKQTEESLRLSEQNFRASIENSPIGIRIVSEDGKTLYVNRALLALYGYSSLEELVSVSSRQLYTPESYAAHRERVEKRKRGGYVPPNYEISIVRKDGQVRNLAVSRGEVLWNGEKQFQVLYQDITERKVRETEYQTIISTTIDGFWMADMQGRFLDVNEAYCSLIGYSRDELLNMSIQDVEAIEKPEEVVNRMQKIVEVGHDRFESRHRRKDGEIIDVEVSVNYLPIDSGRLVVFIRDINERRQAEEALRASEARYRLIAENVRDVIWSMDMDLRFTYVSPSVKYFGYRGAEEVTSMSLEQILTPSSQKLAIKTFSEELSMADVTVRDPNRSRTIEVEILRLDGSAIWAELKMSFLRDTNGRPVGILGVMRDISERKQAEEERRAMQQKAQLASHLASVGELSAGIAHEINNPLTGVIGYAELLLQENIPKHIRSDIEVIHDGAKRVADVVKGLLTFARQTRPERTVVDINQVVQVVLRLRAYELETGNIKVTTKLAPDLPVTVADAGQLQQVFLNLIINAEMEMRSKHGKGNLTIRTEQIDSTIRISFRDDGPGIPEENLKRIFDPFFTTRETGKGTGLGLSICHGIVTEHKGRIHVESQLGKGANFVVELPVIAEKERPRRAKLVRKQKKVTGAKILVVDDEPVVRRLLSQVLTEEGYEVETTDDGEDALNRIRSGSYSLVLLDMRLLGMSGSELYERIKRTGSSLAQRIIFITGDVMGTDTESFLARTKAHYITKPFDVNNLRAEVRRLLARHQPKRAAKSKKSKTKG